MQYLKADYRKMGYFILRQQGDENVFRDGNTVRPISPFATMTSYTFSSHDNFKTLIYLSKRDTMAVSKGRLSSFVAKNLEWHFKSLRISHFLLTSNL